MPKPNYRWFIQERSSNHSRARHTRANLWKGLNERAHELCSVDISFISIYFSVIKWYWNKDHELISRASSCVAPPPIMSIVALKFSSSRFNDKMSEGFAFDIELWLNNFDKKGQITTVTILVISLKQTCNRLVWSFVIDALSTSCHWRNIWLWFFIWNLMKYFF